MIFDNVRLQVYVGCNDVQLLSREKVSNINVSLLNKY